MRVPNPWKAVKAAFTPPKGKSERTSFSLGERPIHGMEPPPPSQKKEKAGEREGHPVEKKIEKNEEMLKKVFHVPASSDVVFRDLVVSQPRVRVTVAYVEGLANSDKVLNSVLQPLMLLSSIRKPDERDPVKQMKDALLTSGQVEEKTTYEELVESMIVGDSVVLIDGQDRALAVETKGWEHRMVNEAVSERIVRGPQQGLVEVLRINTALIRSILQTPDLVIENVDLGVTSRNRCAMLYVDSIANSKVVAELRRRLNGLDTSDVLTSGVLEQLIEVHHSLFPTTMSTERPDRVARFLLQGACAVLVSGDPFAIVIPVSFFSFIQSPEDVYIRWPYGNFLRAIRYLGFFLVVYLPGLYVAIVNYHPEMVPTSLIMAIAASREPIPFPLAAEVLMMYAGFELIREAGIRIPSPIGPTIGIVGALLIGEAAVSASVVSPIMVIVVAVTAVSSFTIPNQEMAMFTRVATLLVIIVGATLGLLGIVTLTYIMVCHATSLMSLGIPYIGPASPVRGKSAYSPEVVPAWRDSERAPGLRPKDLTRQAPTARLWDKGEILKPSTKASQLKTNEGTNRSEKGGATDAEAGQSSEQQGQDQQQTGRGDRERQGEGT